MPTLPLALVVEKVAKLRPQLSGDQPDRSPDRGPFWLSELCALRYVEREQHDADLVSGERDLVRKLRERSVARHARDRRRLQRRR